MREIRLRVDSSLDAVPDIGALVREASLGAGFEHDEAALIELATVEGATNVIKHGYSGASGSDVDLLVIAGGGEIEIEVSDHGRSIAPEIAAAASKLPAFDRADRQSLPVSGMGLSIMRQVMDEVSFRQSEGRNTLRMVKRRKA